MCMCIIYDMMINEYEDIRQLMLVCRRCSYPLSRNQLQDVVVNKCLFGIQWKCPVCLNVNENKSDHNFNFYCNNSSTIVKQKVAQYSVLVMIQASQDMQRQLFQVIPPCVMKEEGKKVSLCMQKMMKKSNLLKEYKSLEGGSLRKKMGRAYSWKNFINSKYITKQEYSLWYADQIKNQTNCIIKFYSNNNNNHNNDTRTTKQELTNIINKNYGQFVSFGQNIKGMRVKSVVIIGHTIPSQYCKLDMPVYGKLLTQTHEHIKELNKNTAQIYRDNICEQINRIKDVRNSIVVFMNNRSGQWVNAIPMSDYRILKHNKQYQLSLLSQSIQSTNEHTLKKIKSQILKQFMGMCDRGGQRQQIRKMMNELNKYHNHSHSMKIVVQVNSAKVNYSYYVYYSNISDNGRQEYLQLFPLDNMETHQLKFV